MPGSITLITGGVKSGKSAHALKLAEALGPRRTFIATATAGDDEMARKIQAHQAERADRWRTVEEPRDIAAVLGRATIQSDVVLIDCLTLWVSNLLTLFNLPQEAIMAEIEGLAAALEKAQAPVVVVTNEVGLGIMPADRLSRQYQNLLGAANKRIAAIAAEAFLMVSGLPVKIK